MLFTRVHPHRVKAIFGLMAIGTGMVEDMNGVREDGTDPGQAGYGMMAVGTRPGVVGDGTGDIGRNK